MKLKHLFAVTALFFVFLASSCKKNYSYHCQCDDPNSGRVGTLNATVEAKDQEEALEKCQEEYPDASCSATKEF